MEYQRCFLEGAGVGEIPEMHLGGQRCIMHMLEAGGGIPEKHLLEGGGVGGIREMHLGECGDVCGIPEMHLGGWRCRWNTRDASSKVEVEYQRCIRWRMEVYSRWNTRDASWWVEE